MNPPEMRPWNLALRLGLEIGALTGLGLAAWTQTQGAARSVAVAAAPLAAAALWGTFNVLDDPSRSGEAPVEVPGSVRLAIELIVLGGGGVAYGIAGYPAIGSGFAALTVLHYTVARTRVQWLLSR
jgi:hypothetical protein